MGDGKYQTSTDIFIASNRLSSLHTNIRSNRDEMSNHTRRILHWVNTANHIFETDCVEIEDVGSLIGADNVHENSTDIPTSALSEQTVNTPTSDSSDSPIKESPNTKSEAIEWLIGRDSDILVPSTEQINSTFLQGQNS
jgi:hypothetical protein